MKFLSVLCLSFLLAIPVFAQDAHEGSIRFNKEDRNGVMGEYNAPKDQTEGALAVVLGNANLGRRQSTKGFWKYEGVTWPEISPDKVDIYFNVERHKGNSIVYMLVSTGYDNFVTTASNPQVIANMKAFLTKFKDELGAYVQREAIAAQQKIVADAEKALKSADRATDRANRKQSKADREKAKSQEKAEEERKKLEELEKNKH